jgi:uncharacterized protein (DUF58 family)
MAEPLRDALLAGELAGLRYSLRTPRHLPLGILGAQQGARAGSSLEFREHREYEPGDDLRHVDWNAYARTDQLIVKRYHEEVTPHLDLVLDGSRSMALVEAKSAAAVGLCGFLAAAAENAGMSHRVWLTREGCEMLDGSAGRPAGWQLPTFDHPGHPAEAMMRRPSPLKPRGVRIVVSDLFWLGDPMVLLGPCAERATSLVVVQVLARTDVDPSETGNLRLVDAETDEVLDLLVDAAALARYRTKFDRHRKNWNDACRRAGATFATVVAEDFLRERRLDELAAAEILQVT